MYGMYICGISKLLESFYPPANVIIHTFPFSNFFVHSHMYVHTLIKYNTFCLGSLSALTLSMYVDCIMFNVYVLMFELKL